jgi:acyl-CoA thioester hydrolase
MKTHKTDIRVRYEETDRMGVVYYANYLIWFEVGRTEFFKMLGMSYRDLEDKDGLRLMVVESKINYKAPATYDDLVSIETTIGNIKNTSISFSYKVYRDNTLLAIGDTAHVFTNKGGKPIRIPGKIREKLIS